ncbi:MAG: hypothetical protein AAB546_00215 [Patescibacteria group bacterium]|mgnify:CR=1 FL=1
MSKLNLSLIAHILLVVSILGLFGYVFRVDQRLKEIYSLEVNKTEQQIVIPSITKQQLQTAISQAIATLSANPKTTPLAPVATAKPSTSVSTTSGSKTSYIPMGSVWSTQSTDWVDVEDSDVYIDLANDFSSTAYVTLETNLKVANANGQAFVRLKDVTSGIIVNGSELSTTNNADYTRVSSPKLNLWSGKNLYRIQIKSLNSSLVTYSGGKLKLVY